MVGTKAIDARSAWPLVIARLAGMLSLVLGAIVLLGWYLHEPALIQVNPAFVPMQYNTALGFGLSGLALLAATWHWPRIAWVTGLVVLLTGVLTLIEYIFDVDLHIDQLFMEHYIDLQTSNPGRMAPNTALCFSLTGLTILLGQVLRNRESVTSWIATLGALIISLGVTALAGYMIGVEGAYGWGHMTRMAIHTAAGFIVLGTGFLGLAWATTHLASKEKQLPRWTPQVIGITGFTITFALWQAMAAQEDRLVSTMGQGAANFSDEGFLVFGLLLTVVLALKARTLARAAGSKRRAGRVYAPYVTIALGGLLAASLYSLLHTNDEVSARQRFDAAVQGHVEATEHGIAAYLENLYHIRSVFDASTEVTRSEFRTLVNRSLERNPGIVALEWVPKVPGDERERLEQEAREQGVPDFRIRNHIGAEQGVSVEGERPVYYPIYYVEPELEYRSALGFDLAVRPDYLKVLNRAVREDGPAVSPRLQLFQSEEGNYSVFVALPVYRQVAGLSSPTGRDAALRGFVVMVVEVGPMINAILDENTQPAGLTLTFTDSSAQNDKAFMYRHRSRLLDLGPDNRSEDFLDDGFSDTAPLAFADQQWLVTAQAASRSEFSAWDAENLWLPAGVFFLSLGLAWFLYRINRTEAELAHSRMLMHAVLEHSPAVIYLKDLGGRYLMVNRIWSDVIGVQEDRAIGLTDHQIMPAEVAEEYIANDRQVIESRQAVKAEEHVPQDDGSVHTFVSYKFPVADAAGKVFAVGGVSTDITEIKQRERQYRVLVDTIPGTVFRCRLDRQWTMLFISQEVETLTGYPPEDFLNNRKRSFASIIHPDDGARTDSVVAEAVKNGKPYMTEYRVIRKDGSVRYVYERGQAEYDDKGVPEMLDGTIIDVTELKSLQADLEQAKDDADAANQAKSAFLANMSHELRTPMNAILGYSEMLMEEAEDAEQDDFIPDLKKINQAGNHLLSLINDVLDISKIEAGKIEVFPEDIDINGLIDEVSATAIPLMDKNGNKLAIERGKNLGTAHQDLTKLRQTLFNLLSNAAKFTHQGTISLIANRVTGEDADWLILAVSDTGIGIPEDKLDRVFDEFTQADGTTTRDYGGTGLGLAISRRFCQLLGGDLTVFSEVGSGSTFTVRVPMVLPGAKKADSEPQTPVEKTGTGTPAQVSESDGSVILVIDDDPEACEIISRYLTRDGFSVVTAANGEEGLRLAHEVNPTAITLDVMMPEMDGWSVLRALKADPKLRTIPVVMLTMIEDRTRGYSLGAVDYLTKPVDKEQLHKALAQYHQPGEQCEVLLVEDDGETREVMRHNLEKAGWAVVEAGNGQEALDRLEEMADSPRLVLLDLMMPVMDGFAFLARMRARAEWHDIPVIVVTAKDLTDDDRARLGGMVADVLEKNAYTREDLLERVREAVARNKV